MLKSKKDKLKFLLDKVREKQTRESRQVYNPYSDQHFDYSTLGRTPEEPPIRPEPIREEITPTKEETLESIRQPYPDQEIRQAEPKSFVRQAWDVVKTPFVKSPEEQQTGDWRTYATSKVKNISEEEAATQIKKEKKEDFNRKIEIASMMLGAGALGAGKLTAMKLAKGIASFMAVHGTKQAIIRKISNGTKEDLVDFLNDNTNEGARQAATLLELLGETRVAGGVEGKAVSPLLGKMKTKFFPEKGLTIIKELVSNEAANDLKTLNLKEGASRTQVNKKYRELAHVFSPDKNPGASPIQVQKMNKVMSEINAAAGRLRKGYRPEPTGAKDITPTMTPTNQKHIDALEVLGLKWGASRSEINRKYLLWRKQGDISNKRQEAFNTLMRGKDKYNPYGEAESYIQRKAKGEKISEAEQKKMNTLAREKAVIEAQGKLQTKLPERQAANYLPKIVGKPEFPAVDTPQAGFQIVDPVKQKRLKTLKNKLEAIRDKKQEVIASGRAGATVKSEITVLKNTITNLTEKIDRAQTAMITKTGPITPKKAPTTKAIPLPAKTIQPSTPSKPIKEKINKIKAEVTQKKIVKALKNKPKEVKPKEVEPKTYKELVEKARKVSAKPTSSAISRILGGRSRESLERAAAEKARGKVKQKVSVEKEPSLAKLKREGADVNVLAEKSRVAYLDFLEGKTKTDKSIEIDDFIADNYGNESEAFYARKTRAEAKPESRRLKEPTKRTILGKLKSLFARKKEWQLYEEMQKFIHKYAKLVSERHVGRGAEGVYRRKSGNISVRSTNNIFTVTHEVAHSLADSFGIIDKIISNKDKTIQKLLKDVFIKYYPTNKKLPLEDTLHEGFATLVEQYALQPKQITKEFPELINAFFKADGKYANKTVLKAVRDVNRIIAKFLSLDVYEQEASKIVFNERYVKPSTIYTKVDKLIKQQVDYVRMLEKYAIVNKVNGTNHDPSVYFRLVPSVGRIAVENIAGRDGYVSIDSYGTPKKVLDFNWRTLGAKIGDDGAYRNYNAYLYNRRLYHINEKVKGLEAKEALTKEEKIELKENKSILTKSKFNGETTDIIMNERPETFVDFDKDFDTLANVPIKDMVSSGLISEKYGKKLSDTKGYAKFARDILDEIEGENIGNLFMSGKVTKPSPLKGEFKGSEKPPKDLFVSTAKAGLTVNEQIMLQRTLKEMGKLESFGETDIIGKRKIKPEETTFFPKINGNTVEFRDGNEWITMKISNELLDVFVVAKEMRKTDGLRKIARKLSNVFVQGTTGALYPAFAVTNLFIDWIPAFAQSKNKLIPIYSGVKVMSLALKGRIGKANKYTNYWDDYKRGGASSQTMIRTFEDNPSDILKDMRLSQNVTQNVMGISMDKASAGLTYMSERSEALNRFGEYVKVRESGRNHAVAMTAAEEITGAFGRRGVMLNPTLRALEESSVYANSTKQYIYSAIKAVVDKDTRRKAIGTHLVVGGITLISFLYMVKNYEDAKKSGDKKRILMAQSLINEYMNQNKYGLSNNIYTIRPDLKDLTKIRVAGNYNDIGALLSMMFAEKMLDKEYNMKDYLGVVKDLYVPNQYDVLEKNPGNMMPQIAKPLVEIAFNKKTFPKMRDIVPKYMLRYPREKRYYPWTNDTAIWLATTPVAKMLDLSPLQIEHWMKGTGGRAIDVMTKYADEGIIKGVAKGQIEAFKRIVQNETYMFNGVEYAQFYEDAEKSTNKYTELRKGQDRNAISQQKQINDIYKGVSNQLKELKIVNSSDDVAVPLSVSNKLFDIIHMLNTKKYRTAEKYYDRYKYSIDAFIDKAGIIIKR